MHFTQRVTTDIFSNLLVRCQGALAPGGHRGDKERKELTDTRLKKPITTETNDEMCHVHMGCKRELVRLLQQMDLRPQVSLKHVHIGLCRLCLRAQGSE